MFSPICMNGWMDGCLVILPRLKRRWRDDVHPNQIVWFQQLWNSVRRSTLFIPFKNNNKRLGRFETTREKIKLV